MLNRKMVITIIGKMLGILGVLMMLPVIVGVIYRENDFKYFLLVGVVLIIIGVIATYIRPKNTLIYGKEGLVIIGVVWILWAIFGSIPFVISGAISNPIDAFFETVSGFTTTGSTILKNIESLSHPMAFWRCFTHWIGGMGVLVFVMTITTLDKDNSMHLMRAEVPGPEADKIVPKAKDSSRILYIIYFALTFVEILFLKAGGMDWFDSIIHSFSTAGTGGFSNKNTSIAFYNSAYIEGVITVFMTLFGINFNLYFLLRYKRFKEVLKDEELRAYLGIVFLATLTIALNILNYMGNFFSAIRFSAFQVSAVITTTGFMSADYNLWPEFSKTILLFLMVVGASAGSTGGGIKISRFLILLKSIKKEANNMVRPKAVYAVKLNGKRVSDKTLYGVKIYFISYIIILMVSVLIISLNNFDFATSFSSVLTTLNNVGPGISLIGPTENFSNFSNISKIVLSFDMLIGRLEIFPYLILISPYIWKKKY